MNTTRLLISRRPVRLILATLALLFLAVTFRPVIEGDGVGYYAYLHAVLVSHSLDFANEYTAAVAANIPVDPLASAGQATGHVADVFPIGPALLSSPVYLVALPQRPHGSTIDPLHGNYLEILFSSYNSLFVWTPAAIFAAAGFFFIKDRRMQVACAATHQTATGRQLVAARNPATRLEAAIAPATSGA